MPLSLLLVPLFDTEESQEWSSCHYVICCKPRVWGHNLIMALSHPKEECCHLVAPGFGGTTQSGRPLGYKEM